jgi:hypothetical protein
MFNSNKKEMELYKREMELYKREKELEIREDVFNRKVNNWKPVDDARVANHTKQLELGLENARQEGYQTAIKEANSIKDQEIELLKGLLLEAIKALQIRTKDSVN